MHRLIYLHRQEKHNPFRESLATATYLELHHYLRPDLQNQILMIQKLDEIALISKFRPNWHLIVSLFVKILSVLDPIR